MLVGIRPLMVTQSVKASDVDSPTLPSLSTVSVIHVRAWAAGAKTRNPRLRTARNPIRLIPLIPFLTDNMHYILLLLLALTNSEILQKER